MVITDNHHQKSKQVSSYMSLKMKNNNNCSISLQSTQDFFVLFLILFVSETVHDSKW